MADNNGVMMMSNNNTPRKKTKGKSKIPMELIRDRKSRFVSFSKRKKGLFKKMDMLSSSFSSYIEMAGIVFSPTGKPYSFGYPSTDAVVGRFLGRDGGVNGGGGGDLKNREGGFWWDDVNVDSLNLEQLEALKCSLEEVKNIAFQKAVDILSDGS
ncbi:agamous-like MADS-box protein AGL62 [Spinacia oleracea]|uniref:Agamous-like MADS-box protein AGL62 n=1 Tax=Spinacia oleracea TaxID=3562 RepID=A0ABM3QGC2_SPIOL|nr:agamous-like MADS-box protein AGL62 [Spinacia oleracea]